MPERDSALGQIVRGEFHRDAVTRKDADAIAAQAASQMRQYHPFMFQLHAEESAREFFQDGAGYFNAVFFTQSISFCLYLLLSFDCLSCNGSLDKWRQNEKKGEPGGYGETHSTREILRFTRPEKRSFGENAADNRSMRFDYT